MKKCCICGEIFNDNDILEIGSNSFICEKCYNKVNSDNKKGKKKIKDEIRNENFWTGTFKIVNYIMLFLGFVIGIYIGIKFKSVGYGAIIFIISFALFILNMVICEISNNIIRLLDKKN